MALSAPTPIKCVWLSQLVTLARPFRHGIVGVGVMSHTIWHGDDERASCESSQRWCLYAPTLASTSSISGVAPGTSSM